MFQGLQDKFGEILGNLKKRGSLKESDVKEALRQVRIALLEADVALPVVKKLIKDIETKAIGQEILRSISPAQMVIKIVNDHMIEVLGTKSEDINLKTSPPAIILVAGLQGSGKTTTVIKLAHKIKSKMNKKVLVASLDVYRPAAQQQLKILGEQADISSLPIIDGQLPLDIAKRSIKAGALQGTDVIILDTAGRMNVDEALMTELSQIHATVKPIETLLVADSLTGQDAVNIAKAFKERINITGIALTRIDGDARGGAAISMKSVTGCPIKVLGTGEKIDDLENFHPDRIVSRILGMGDVVSLVEKAKETIDEEDAQKLEKKILKGQFDLNDLRDQLRQMKKMGGMSGLMTMLPGISKVKKQMSQSNIDEKMLLHQEAIINSMTPKERIHVKVLNASRKRRIAAGAGVEIQDVNRVLKQYKQMSLVMKKMKKMGKKGKNINPEAINNLIPNQNFFKH
ncbi:MAG: signal recognition particle protein [Rhodospirillaceae bacterium]|nr:signal recognition particle protein [Rhodospirillaceae bacterium]|tara:strand:- start:2547 stop:3920 length:1374 start_codon:yes stop_codon:yes gene_type:complete